MKIKAFHIRLTKENIQSDQEKINNFLESVNVRKTATELITGQPNYWSVLVFYEELNSDFVEPHPKFAVTDYKELDKEEREILDILKEWREDKAKQLNVPLYLICHNSEFMSVAKAKPNNLEELSRIKGFAGRKLAKIGDEIIAVLNAIQKNI